VRSNCLGGRDRTKKQLVPRQQEDRLFKLTLKHKHTHTHAHTHTHKLAQHTYACTRTHKHTETRIACIHARTNSNITNTHIHTHTCAHTQFSHEVPTILPKFLPFDEQGEGIGTINRVNLLLICTKTGLARCYLQEPRKRQEMICPAKWHRNHLRYGVEPITGRNREGGRQDPVSHDEDTCQATFVCAANASPAAYVMPLSCCLLVASCQVCMLPSPIV
jgi:hypothetical protein